MFGICHSDNGGGGGVTLSAFTELLDATAATFAAIGWVSTFWALALPPPPAPAATAATAAATLLLLVFDADD